MVSLVNKSIRDNYGIDTFERGLAWSLLLLREGYVNSGDSDYDNYFRFSISTRNVNSIPRGLLNFEGNVDVPETVHSDGVDVLNNIIQSVTSSITYDGEPATATAYPLVTMSADNSNVTNLEQYFYWCAINLIIHNYDYFHNRIIITQKYTNRDTTNTIRINGNLDINYPTFLDKGLIESIGVDDYGVTPVIIPVIGDGSNSGQLKNGSQLSNDNQLNNGDNNNNNQLSNSNQLSNDNQLVN